MYIVKDELTSQALSNSDGSDASFRNNNPPPKVVSTKTARQSAAPSRGLRRTTTLSSGLLEPSLLAPTPTSTPPTSTPPHAQQVISITVHRAADGSLPESTTDRQRETKHILSPRNSISNDGVDVEAKSGKSNASLMKKVGKLLSKEPSHAKEKVRMYTKASGASLDECPLEETSLSDQSLDGKLGVDTSKSKKCSEGPFAKPLHHSKTVHRGSSINGDDFLREEEEARCMAISMGLKLPSYVFTPLCLHYLYILICLSVKGKIERSDLLFLVAN